MVRVYSDGTYCYSVNEMFKYINSNSLEVHQIPVSELAHQLEYDCWDDKVSPNDVINNPQQHDKEYTRIMNVEMKYPIIMCENYIIDGMHRLSYAYINNHETINVYKFTPVILDMFKIC